MRRLLEVVKEEKRKMHLQLQHLLEEEIGESFIPEASNNPSKMKPICGHGPNIGYGPYVENDVCEFFQHLKDSSYVSVGKSGWLESSSTSPSISKKQNMGDKSKEAINISSSTPSIKCR